MDNATSFQLERPDGIMEDVTFEITAEDAAGNEKITRVTLKNKILNPWCVATGLFFAYLSLFLI